MMRRAHVKQGSAPQPVELNLASVTIKPGDTLVITTERFLTADQHASIKQCVESALPGVKALVLVGGLRATGLSRQ